MRSVIVAVSLLALLVACGSSGNQSPAHGVTAVTRQLLQSSASDRAAGQSLDLVRVIIPAGQTIAPHTHPGVQLAFIADGTLTYSVIQGEVQVTRAAGTELARTETVRSGQTSEIRPGDALRETPGMVHAARNAGKKAIVIYISSLFPEGAPASSPVP